MNIEEQIFKLYDEIKQVQSNIDNMNKIDYDILHQYTDCLFQLKVKLQKLENNSYLERNPDLEGDEVDLYLRNIHDKNEKNPDKLSYIITLHGTKIKIGVTDVRLNLLDSEKYLGNIGTRIYDDYRGKRYSKKAFSLLKDVMLSYGLRKPVFTVVATNKSSIKSLDTIGAKQIDFIQDVENPYYVYEYDLEQEDSLKK